MNLMQLNTRPLHRRAMSGRNLPQVTLDELAAHADGPDLPDRRPRRPAWAASMPAGQQRQGPRAAGAAGRDLSRTGFTSNCSATPAPAARCPRPKRWPSAGAVELAYEMGLPLVATNDVYFPKAEMYRGA